MAEKQPVSGKRGTESGTLGDDTQPIDPDLLALVDAWPMLPADVRKMIAGVVKLTPKNGNAQEREPAKPSEGGRR